MKKIIIFMLILVVIASVALTGISCKSNTTETTATPTTKAEATETTEAATTTEAVQTTSGFKPEEKKVYFICTLLSHPVMRLMTLGFFTKAVELGYKPKLVGTLDFNDVATLQAGEQIVAQGADGIVLYAYAETYFPLIEKARKAGIPVIVPQILWPEGQAPGITENIAIDAKQYTRDMADALAKKINYKGTIAPSIGLLSNPTEVVIIDEFKKYCAEKYKDIIVLDALEIGPPGKEAEGTSKVVAHILAHPEINAAFNSSAQGPEVWVNAFDETNRKDIYFIGMDYMQKNLDYIKEGKIYGVIGQPFYEMLEKSAVDLDKIMRGEKVPYQTIVDSPIITQDTPDKVQFYIDLQTNMDAAFDKLGAKL